MSRVFDLVGFAAELKTIDRDLEELFGGHGHNSRIVAKACDIVARKARSMIGKANPDWPALAPATIVDKKERGYKTPAPLLRSGEMRDSIEYVVKGNEGAVGSNSEIAVYQELGTSRIPPRSFLVSAAQKSEERIHRMAGRAIESVLAGGGHNSAALRELWHLAREAGHALHEAAEPILPRDDEEESER